MSIPIRKPRLAVVSPFLDKSHGTERMIVEWLSRLDGRFELHVYSQHVEDLQHSAVIWHRIPKLPGPHLFNYVWWFAANHLCRWWHREVHDLRYDLVFSPGVNCLDSDVVSVHIIFAELLRRIGAQLQLRTNPVRSWPVLVHRRLYYRLIVALEHRVFTNPDTQLILTSPRTAAELERLYSRSEKFPLVCAGIDPATFNPARRESLRSEARRSLGLAPDDFVLTLIGNDWRKKGLAALLQAIANLPELPLRLLVVGSESSATLRSFQKCFPDERVIFLKPRRDVEFYYAATDAYVGPSLEDTFALPALEAMACGLPVIMSSRAGVAAFIQNGANGLIIDDPTDAASLASTIRKLYAQPELCARLGEKASETARQFTWEQNADLLAQIFEQVISRKLQARMQTMTQEI